jgi:hypothetical protein
MRKTMAMALLFAAAVCAEQPPQEVLTVTNTVLSGKGLGHALTPRILMQWKFDSGTTIADLKADVPIHLYRFIADSLKKIGGNASIRNVIVPEDTWVVPLFKEGGKARVVLWIGRNPEDQKWSIAGYGCSPLAYAWENVKKEWPVSAGYHPILIGTMGDETYYYIPEKGERNLTRLTWATRYNFDYYDTSATAYAVLDSSCMLLDTVIKKMLEPPAKDSNESGY